MFRNLSKIGKNDDWMWLLLIVFVLFAAPVTAVKKSRRKVVFFGVLVAAVLLGIAYFTHGTWLNS